MDPAIAVTGCMTESEPARRVVLFHRLRVFKEGICLVREFGETGLRRRFDAVVDHIAGIANRNRNPLIAALAVLDRTLDPATIFLAEVLCDVGHVDAFLWKEVWQRIKTPEK